MQISQTCFMVESYLIVGGSSDIALELGSKLLGKGHSITLLARDTERVQGLVSQGAHLVQGDALDKECVQQAVDLAKENGEGSLSGVAHLVGSLVLRPPILLHSKPSKRSFIPTSQVPF